MARHACALTVTHLQKSIPRGSKAQQTQKQPVQASGPGSTSSEPCRSCAVRSPSGRWVSSFRACCLCFRSRVQIGCSAFPSSAKLSGALFPLDQLQKLHRASARGTERKEQLTFVRLWTRRPLEQKLGQPPKDVTDDQNTAQASLAARATAAPSHQSLSTGSLSCPARSACLLLKSWPSTHLTCCHDGFMLCHDGLLWPCIFLINSRCLSCSSGHQVSIPDPASCIEWSNTAMLS